MARRSDTRTGPSRDQLARRKEIRLGCLMNEIRQASTPHDYAAFHSVLVRYSDFLAKRGMVTVPSEELAESPGSLSVRYGFPTGAAFVAIVDAVPIGCVAVRKLDETTAELRRLHVIEDHQERGIGRALVLRAIETARILGYVCIRLGTNTALHNALRLYHKLGFYEIPRYPGADLEDTVFMELTFHNMGNG